MKIWQIGIISIAATAIIGVMVTANPADASQPIGASDKFSIADYEMFDRDFTVRNNICGVGLAKHKMCFTDSPLQSQLVKGEKLKQHIPVMAAEFQIMVAAPAKADHQKLLRYGTRLALLNKETLIIEDILDLKSRQS